jgi:DNA-binding CsgD family transcriptional regulator
LTQPGKPEAAFGSPQPDGTAGLPDDSKIGSLSAERAGIASEVGAAMAHELIGPMTALLLYVGDIQQNSARLLDAGSEGESLKHVIENAYSEAERICSLINRMGDFFETQIPEESAIAVGRDAIAWWSRVGGAAGKAGNAAGHRPVEDCSRSGAKPLTPREREVLRLVSGGCSNKEGAMLMKISYRTFECHRAEVMRKLGAKNTAELVRRALLEMTDACILPERHNT